MTYTYLCEPCNNEFDTEQSITHESKAACPLCNCVTTKRLITGGNFLLKGSVWSKDGYHSNIRQQLKELPQSKDED